MEGISADCNGTVKVGSEVQVQRLMIVPDEVPVSGTTSTIKISFFRANSFSACVMDGRIRMMKRLFADGTHSSYSQVGMNPWYMVPLFRTL